MGAEQSYQKPNKGKKAVRFYIGSETDTESDLSTGICCPPGPPGPAGESGSHERSQVDQQAEQLYNCLMYDRLKLPEIIHNMSYFNMRTIVERIENCHFKDDEFKNRSVWNELCLGKHGRINNQQMAIYEVPTKELIDLIVKVVNDTGVAKVEELCAGMGLLSAILAKRGIIVKATDGNAWIETLAPKRYVNVEEKLLIKYNIDNDLDDSTLYIGAWPVPSSKKAKDFMSFMKDTRPKFYLFIGENKGINRTIEEMHNFMLENGYSSFELFPNQISYKDYFSKNYCRYGLSQQRSATILYVDKNKAPEFQLNMDNYPVANPVAYGPKNYVQDMIVEGILPHCYLNIPYTNAMIKKVHEQLHTTLKIDKNIFETVEEYEFYLKKSYPIIKFPKISTRKEFLEYKEMISILESDGGYQKLLDSGYFPQWMETSPEQTRHIVAEQFIFVDFSTKSKAWKETSNTFATQFAKTSQVSYF